MYDYITLPYSNGLNENRFQQQRFTGIPKAIHVETPRVPNFNSLICEQQNCQNNLLMDKGTYRSAAPNFPPPPPPSSELDLETQGKIFFLRRF